MINMLKSQALEVRQLSLSSILVSFLFVSNHQGNSVLISLYPPMRPSCFFILCTFARTECLEDSNGKEKTRTPVFMTGAQLTDRKDTWKTRVYITNCREVPLLSNFKASWRARMRWQHFLETKDGLANTHTKSPPSIGNQGNTSSNYNEIFFNVLFIFRK